MRIRLIVGLVAAVACYALAAGVAEASFPGRNGLIAYSRVGPHTEETIALVDPRSGGTRQLTRVSRRCRNRASWVDYSPSFSASGRMLVYSHFDSCDRRNPDGVYVIRSNGTGRRLVMRPFDRSDLPESPALSPSGEWLAFHNDVSELIVTPWQRPRPMQELPLPDRYLSAEGPAWGANEKLAFAIADLGKSLWGHIVTARADGKRFRVVTRSTRDSQPDWAPNARRLVFRREAVGFDWDLVPLPSKRGFRQKRGVWQGDVFVAGNRGVGRGGLRRLTYTRDAWAPVWSPDGSYIAYARATDGADGIASGSLWIMRARDGRGQRLMATGLGVGIPRIGWQPRPRR